MAILVDYKASRLSEAANWKNGSISEHTFLVYTLCLIAALLLLVVGTLSMFLVLLNAACKVFIFYDLSISMTVINTARDYYKIIKTYMLFTDWEIRTRKIFCRGLKNERPRQNIFQYEPI